MHILPVVFFSKDTSLKFNWNCEDEAFTVWFWVRILPSRTNMAILLSQMAHK